MVLYKEENFLVVHPGSKHTLFSFGLQDSLSPPQYKIPSIVYQDPKTKEYKSKRNENEDGEGSIKLIEIHPIKAAKIVDVNAFNYLLKIILQSVITNNPIITINQIPLLLIIPSLTWSRANIEYVTKYVIETLEFTAFNILDISLASTFGIGSSTNSIVVNVGYESMQIVPVLGYQIIKYASKYINGVGSNLINEELAKILPNLSSSQIEDLKTSNIYEVLNDHADSFYTYDDINNAGVTNDEDEFDIAKKITEDSVEPTTIAETNGNSKPEESNGNTKQEEEVSEEDQKPNHELETNKFIDSKTGSKIAVGKERFQGCNKLINIIAENIYKSLKLIPDLEKRQECYTNIIIVGSTGKIPGFKEGVLYKLSQDYRIREPRTDNGTSGGDDGKDDGINSALAKYQQAEDDVEGESNNDLSQVPNTIKLAKYPDYFPEWKKPKEKGGSWDDIYFLGGEIYGKQIFSNNSNHGRELFIDSDVYEERGPQSIWDVSI
ncbi:actin-like protein ARP9 [Scheffersomyces coipomensis]|uniref:actin-like protein ARP9 n=1 Tax=Scheffersomyces coipomensis TaxID=1788519 RepID=UPI00315CF057